VQQHPRYVTCLEQKRVYRSFCWVVICPENPETWDHFASLKLHSYPYPL
jgi:hypothetical protein